jgi:hypothetical protein
MDRTDCGDRGGLAGLALSSGRAGLGGQVLAVTGSGGPEHPAKPLHAEFGAMVGDEVPAAGLHFTAIAKYMRTLDYTVMVCQSSPAKLRAWWLGTNVEGKTASGAMYFDGMTNSVEAVQVDASSGFANYMLSTAPGPL